MSRCETQKIYLAKSLSLCSPARIAMPGTAAPVRRGPPPPPEKIASPGRHHRQRRSSAAGQRSPERAVYGVGETGPPSSDSGSDPTRACSDDGERSAAERACAGVGDSTPCGGVAPARRPRSPNRRISSSPVRAASRDAGNAAGRVVCVSHRCRAAAADAVAALQPHAPMIAGVCLPRVTQH